MRTHPCRTIVTLTAVPACLPCPTFPHNGPSSWSIAAASCMFAVCAGTWSGRPSMTMVWRVGSKAAADNPKLPRMVSSSAAAACAATGMRSVPGVGVSNSPARWYSAAAVVHLAAAAASGSGNARPTRCRSAVAAIQAGGGCWGGRGPPRTGRGRRAAMASTARLRGELLSRRVHGQTHVSPRSSRWHEGGGRRETRHHTEQRRRHSNALLPTPEGEESVARGLFSCMRYRQKARRRRPWSHK